MLLRKPLLPGSVVEVTISVTSADDQLGGVMVYDPLPAALVAQDPLLKASNQQEIPEKEGDVTGKLNSMLYTTGDYNHEFDPSRWFPESPWRWGFGQMEVFPDHVTCFTPTFVAGTSECVYIATVVTTGSGYVLPPAHAWVPAEPGLMGLSGTSHFSVAARSPGA